MDDRLFSDPPAVIGHRGFGKNAEGRPQENTVASLHAAAEAGVDWIEFDVRRTSDDQLVVLHDPAADDGTLVVEHTAAQLAELGIITLEDALATIPVTIGADIEVKPSAEDALVAPDDTTAALLCPHLARERGNRPLLVTSFDPTSLLQVREQVPDVPLGYITWLSFPFDMAVASAKHLGVQALMVHTASYDPPKLPGRRQPEDVIDIAHKAGLELGVWAPPPEELERYVAAGVDAITVDDIPASLDVLRDHSAP